jgi:hypothetical protein
MTAAGAGLLAVPRLGRVVVAVGVVLGAVRFARERRRGMTASVSPLAMLKKERSRSRLRN